MSHKWRPLRQAIDFRASELFGLAFWVPLVMSSGGTWLALDHWETFQDLAATAVQVVGAVVGAVIAGVAIIAAMMSQAFLRKLKLIDRDPIRYMAPFLFTACIGVVAALLLLTIGAVPASTPSWLRGVVAGLASFSAAWTLTSLVETLNMLVQFIGLQQDASEIPDDIDVLPSRTGGRRKDSSTDEGRH